MAYVATADKTPLTQEVRDFGAKLTNGGEWMPFGEKSPLMALPSHQRHAFTVQKSGRATALQLTTLSWPRYQKDDSGIWRITWGNQVYLTVTREMLEITHPDLIGVQEYLSSTGEQRLYAMSSMLMAMLWQKSLDMPAQWQKYCGAITGVPAMAEELTIPLMETRIKLEQWSRKDMKAQAAVMYQDILAAYRTGVKTKAEKAPPAKKMSKLLLGTYGDEDLYYTVHDEAYYE